jgi:hypothetical protein
MAKMVYNPVLPQPSSSQGFSLPTQDIPAGLLEQYNQQQQNLLSNASHQANQGFIHDHPVLSALAGGLAGAAVGGALGRGAGAVIFGARGAGLPAQLEQKRLSAINANYQNQLASLQSGFKDVVGPLAQQRIGAYNAYHGAMAQHQSQLNGQQAAGGLSQLGQAPPSALAPSTHYLPTGINGPGLPSSSPVLQGGVGQTEYAAPPPPDRYYLQRVLADNPGGAMDPGQVNPYLGNLNTARHEALEDALKAAINPSEINQNNANAFNIGQSGLKTQAELPYIPQLQAASIDEKRSQATQNRAGALKTTVEAQLAPGIAQSSNTQRYASAGLASQQAKVVGKDAESRRITALKPVSGGPNSETAQNAILARLEKYGLSQGYLIRKKGANLKGPAPQPDKGWFGDHPPTPESLAKVEDYNRFMAQYNALTAPPGSSQGYPVSAKTPTMTVQRSSLSPEAQRLAKKYGL